MRPAPSPNLFALLLIWADEDTFQAYRCEAARLLATASVIF